MVTILQTVTQIMAFKLTNKSLVPVLVLFSGSGPSSLVALVLVPRTTQFSEKK
jgi:pyruvate/2-oxoacid:ferredoxin oxidoreductase alpha subunit